jgi:L-malate glycosyltransferase
VKIIVFAYELVVCGTTVNSIELAAALRDFHGHDIVFFATPGPMVELIQKKGLRFTPAPPATIHPSPSRARALRDVVRKERPDLIYVWDWYQCLDAYYIEHLLNGVPMVVTDMSMTLQRLLPKALPTTFGTPDLVGQARAAGYRLPELLLPPVDVHENAADAVDPGPFRKRYGIEEGDITLVTVSRLDTWMKSDSLLRTIDVVHTLGRELPLRFVIVGDGDVRSKCMRLARETNAKLRRDAVVLTGALLDPRPAYAAADIIVGMGGSALRGMAFGKPVVIVGERGFSAPLTSDTAESLYDKGIYGVGESTSGNARLVSDIRGLAENPARASALGQFSRQFVVKHFALETVCTQLARICSSAVANPRRLDIAAVDGLRTAAVWLRERRFAAAIRWLPRI